jgi:hypothetical protein
MRLISLRHMLIHHPGMQDILAILFSARRRFRNIDLNSVYPPRWYLIQFLSFRSLYKSLVPTEACDRDGNSVFWVVLWRSPLADIDESPIEQSAHWIEVGSTNRGFHQCISCCIEH